MSVKDKVIRGVAWSAVEKFARQGLVTLFSILIARQLSPSDYGLVAMLNIFWQWLNYLLIQVL